MYTYENFKTKKALKEAVKNGESVGVYQPNCLTNTADRADGPITIEGPQYPKSHEWCANAIIKDGVIVKGTVR